MCTAHILRHAKLTLFTDKRIYNFYTYYNTTLPGFSLTRTLKICALHIFLLCADIVQALKICALHIFLLIFFVYYIKMEIWNSDYTLKDVAVKAVKLKSKWQSIWAFVSQASAIGRVIYLVRTMKNCWNLQDSMM